MKTVVVLASAAALVVTAVRFNSWVAGGSDSYCYVHQAERWAAAASELVRGRIAPLQVVEPLALEAPWPDAARSFAPAGHLPSPTVPGAIVPMCPAGLSMAMAPFVMAGGPHAAFFVLPIFAALLVIATYTVGARYGARVGVAASVLVATSPIVIYQAIQPMSDVPAAALWMVAVAAATGAKSRSALISGLASSAAILMRPNLLPLGIVIGLFVLVRPERTWRERVRMAAQYAACCAPGCVVVALTHQAFFGSPFSSGYGSLSALFATSHILPNMERYLTWLWTSHTAAVALVPLAVWLLPGGLTIFLLSLIAANVAIYVPYVVFEDWTFLRFLLPTIPLMLILVVAVVDAVLRRLKVPQIEWAIATIVVILAVLFVRQARERQAFELQRLEARFARAGAFVGMRLPKQAMVITSWQSGSVRFYGGRKTLVWDVLDPAWLEPALAFVRSRGYEPYLLFERREEPEFRKRFAVSSVATLDWPPMAEVSSQVRIYRPDDRERYLRGTLPPTEYVP